MKIKVKLDNFFELVKAIKYEEDIYSQIYSDYQSFDPETILCHLPTEYKITLDHLEQDQELCNALEHALNRANESGLANAAYEEQMNAVERYSEQMIEYINNVTDVGMNDAIKEIVIDWKNEQVVLDVNLDAALYVIREIINGEGIFCYESVEQLVEMSGGKKSEAVEGHLKYLLNIELIDEIWGCPGRPKFEWDVQSWDIDEEDFADAIIDNLSDVELKFMKSEISSETLLAIQTFNMIEEKDRNLSNLRCELNQRVKKIPKDEMNLYVKETTRKETQE